MREKQRYEREIEELLNQLDTFVPGEEQRPKRPGFFATLGLIFLAFIRGADPGKVALLGVALLLGGVLLRFLFGPFSPVLIVAGAVCLVMAYGLYFTSNRTRTYRKRWRGEEIEIAREPSPLQRWVDTMIDRIRGRR